MRECCASDAGPFSPWHDAAPQGRMPSMQHRTPADRPAARPTPASLFMTPEQEWAYLDQGMIDPVEPTDGGVGIMTDSGPRWYLDRLKERLEA